MNKLLSIIFIMVFSGNNIFCQSLKDESFVQIITSEEINTAGITRLSDVLFLIDGWDSYTIDGYRWSTVANGLEQYKKQQWKVMIDEQDMSINFLDKQNINILPLTLNQIDSVIVYNSPTSVAGNYYDSGLINIVTKNYDDGISIGGYYTSGNPAGDPGPFIYLQNERSENIEEIGPDLSASLNIKKDNTSAGILFLTHTHPNTHINIRRRNTDLGWESLIGRRFSASLNLNTKVDKTSHKLFAGYSTSEEQSFHPEETGVDLFYFNPAGRELPVQTIFKHLGINGIIPVKKNILKYTAQVSNQYLYTAPGFSFADFDWNNLKYFINAEYNFDIIESNTTIGASFNSSRLKTFYSLVDNTIDLLSFYASTTLFSNNEFKNNFGFYLTLANKNILPSLYTSSNYKVDERNTLILKLSYSQKNSAKYNDLWYWESQGYNILDSLGINYFIDDKINNSSKFTTDLAWIVQPNENVKLIIGSNYRFFNSTYIETQKYDFDPAKIIFTSPTIVFTEQSGHTAAFSLNIDHIINSLLFHSFYYKYNKAINGDVVLVNEWKTIPKHKIKYEITLTPATDFSIRTALTFLASSFWNSFEKITEQSNLIYNSEIPGRFLVDISVQKYFWSRRFRLSLLLQNLLNNKIIYHPLGANFSMSLFLKFDLMLNSLIKF